jgi:hypothetical protein
MNGEEMSPVDQALAAARGLLDLAGVVGVGQGQQGGKSGKESGACVVVLVAARTPRLVAALPKQILGVPVAIREIRARQ